MNKHLVEKIVRQEIRRKLLENFLDDQDVPETTHFYRQGKDGPARTSVEWIRRQWYTLIDWAREEVDDDTLGHIIGELKFLEEQLKELGYTPEQVIKQSYLYF